MDRQRNGDYTCTHKRKRSQSPPHYEHMPNWADVFAYKRVTRAGPHKQPCARLNLSERKIMQAAYTKYHTLTSRNPQVNAWMLAAIEFVLRIHYALKYFNGQIDNGHWLYLGGLAALSDAAPPRERDEITSYLLDVFLPSDWKTWEKCTAFHYEVKRQDELAMQIKQARSDNNRRAHRVLQR